MNLKRILALVLALTLCVSLAACGNKNDEGDKKAGKNLVDEQGNPVLDAEGNPIADDGSYVARVVDSLGNPVTKDVIVRFMKDGAQVAMNVVDAAGIAKKELEDGTYTVELQFTDPDANFHYEAKQITADKKFATIVLYNGVGAEHSLFAYSLKAQEKVDAKAYSVGVGATYVTMTVGERNYYVFTPSQSGTYKFSLQSGEGSVGYYGATYFVQDYTAVDVVDGAVSISVRPDSIGSGDTGTSQLVIGVDATSENGVLLIERIGEHEHTVSDEPWTEYKTTHTPSQYTLPQGAKLTYVDIFDGKAEDYQLVMGQDGFYHLGTADGPLMLINLGKEAPNASLEVMINGDGLAGGAPMRHYFYDENNNFVKKEDYTDIMRTYFDAADEKARVYPLTADLEYMIKNSCSGWWTMDDPNYIFQDANEEIGWLFACCYIQ